MDLIVDDKINEVNRATRKTKMMHQYFREQGYYSMEIGKNYHTHAPEGVLDENGGRFMVFGPFHKEYFHWNKVRTSTTWGPFP